MNRLIIFLLCSILFANTHAQPDENISLTLKQVEHIFLEQNLELVAEQMNISLADAAIAQARLWQNPELSISDVNLWSTRSQREGEDVIIPPLFGKFARNTEFSVELSQLIQTANKRGKLVRLEKASKEIAISLFEETLRGLKTELRQLVAELTYLQEYRHVLADEAKTLTTLTNSYQRQVKAGNLAKSELLRLQSALFETENELLEIETELAGSQKELNVLLNMPANVAIIIIPSQENDLIAPSQLILGDLIDQALDHRPDLKMHYQQTLFLEKSLAYERSQRIPDLTVSANYDRFGGVWKDFVGFGISFDLPVFNRNQGNIRAARIGIEQSRYQSKQQQNQAENEIAGALSKYILGYQFYDKIQNNPLISELDEMKNSYTRNLTERNISMMEYIDFIEAYRSNMQTFLHAKRNISIQLEELQYVVGKDLN